LENSHDIKELFSKYLNKTISRDEYDVLLKYFGKQGNDSELNELIGNALSEDIPSNNDLEINEIVDSVEYKLRQKLQPRKRLQPMRYIPYAAIIMATLLGGLYLLFHYQTPKTMDQLITEVKPGGNKAVLTISDGISHQLSADQSEIQINDKGVQYANGKKIIPSAIESIATVETPKGGQYQIILPDHTHVWLNAASSIKFPTIFNGNSREVTITGEAYFEVAKNKSKPFRVKTTDQTVEVLGTHFNINSYADEPSTVTTLAEGSVRVNLVSNGNNYSRAMTIAPGQQTATTKDNITVGKADLYTALAWKNNQIYFKQASIQSIMRQVARWYNIEVEYEGNIPNRKFTGGIYRSDNLNDLLKILMLNDLHFELKDNTLIVKP
jgi:transmembrane sensor